MSMIVVDYPALVFVISFVVLWLSTWFGASVLKRRSPLGEDVRDDLGVILGAAMTLLALIVGFTFSMAVTRYDQRKNLEAAEANAIGTEYVRADLLSAADGAKVRKLLREYLDQRVAIHSTRDVQQIRQINARTAQLQAELWSAVLGPAGAQPTPTVAMVVSGMNDVLNSQAYTQAAWRNRIPIAAWLLMVVIAVCCNVLLGYRLRNATAKSILSLVLPVVFSVSLFLIADIDSPNGGVIRLNPENLRSLAETLRTP